MGHEETVTTTSLRAEAQRLAAEADVIVDAVAEAKSGLYLELGIQNLDSTFAASISTAFDGSEKAITDLCKAVGSVVTSITDTTPVSDAQACVAQGRTDLRTANSTKRAFDLKIGEAKRAPTVAALDKAAAALTGAFTAITTALTAVGFASGDMSAFFRNHLYWALAALILAALAVGIGTMAYLVPAVKSSGMLHLEGFLIGLGMVSAAAAFAIGGWGLGSGTNGNHARPALTASLSPGDSTLEVKVTATRSGVPEQDSLYLAVWGDTGPASTLLYFGRVGPSSDGSATNEADLSVPNDSYRSFIGTALGTPTPTSAMAPPTAPPADCPALTDVAQVHSVASVATTTTLATMAAGSDACITVSSPTEAATSTPTTKPKTTPTSQPKR